MQELKVEKVIISKQKESNENFQKFLEIATQKDIKIKVVKAGNRINFEKDIYFDILWPTNEQISENPLNNNAIVAKLVYKNLSMLFTGDIEEIAEKQILKMYARNSNTLKANILKVAHHGSKTSSTNEFIEAVKPKIALIGVGKNNKFGHPNKNVLNVLNKFRYQDL